MNDLINSTTIVKIESNKKTTIDIIAKSHISSIIKKMVFTIPTAMQNNYFLPSILILSLIPIIAEKESSDSKKDAAPRNPIKQLWQNHKGKIICAGVGIISFVIYRWFSDLKKFETLEDVYRSKRNSDILTSESKIEAANNLVDFATQSWFMGHQEKLQLYNRIKSNPELFPGWVAEEINNKFSFKKTTL